MTWFITNSCLCVDLDSTVHKQSTMSSKEGGRSSGEVAENDGSGEGFEEVKNRRKRDRKRRDGSEGSKSGD